MILRWFKRRKREAQVREIVIQRGRGEDTKTSVEWWILRRSDGRWGFG